MAVWSVVGGARDRQVGGQDEHLQKYSFCVPGSIADTHPAGKSLSVLPPLAAFLRPARNLDRQLPLLAPRERGGGWGRDGVRNTNTSVTHTH